MSLDTLSCLHHLGQVFSVLYHTGVTQRPFNHSPVNSPLCSVGHWPRQAECFVNAQDPVMIHTLDLLPMYMVGHVFSPLGPPVFHNNLLVVALVNDKAVGWTSFYLVWDLLCGESHHCLIWEPLRRCPLETSKTQWNQWDWEHNLVVFLNWCYVSRSQHLEVIVEKIAKLGPKWCWLTKVIQLQKVTCWLLHCIGYVSVQQHTCNDRNTAILSQTSSILLMSDRTVEWIVDDLCRLALPLLLSYGASSFFEATEKMCWYHGKNAETAGI